MKKIILPAVIFLCITSTLRADVEWEAKIRGSAFIPRSSLFRDPVGKLIKPGGTRGYYCDFYSFRVYLFYN